MNIKQLILDRRTIHSYNNKKVNDSTIDSAIQCFLYAPNHRNTQPWNILIATIEQRIKLSQLNIEFKLQKKQLSEIEKLAVEKKMMTPSHLMVILQRNDSDEFQSKEDYAAISCGIMSMQLYLWSENIGCKWSSGKVTYHPKTYKILNIDPNKFTIVGFNWAGYFDRKPPLPKKQNVNDIIIK